MEELKIAEILKKISKEEIFTARAEEAGFEIKVNRYVPYICTAIHDGNQMRKELLDKVEPDSYERWYEEDPHTGSFIQSMPITIVGLDSRFEYDLNRSPENCIYQEAWGKNVWKKQLTKSEKAKSTSKHKAYYTVLKALVQKIEDMFNGCVLYDIHSYNYKRWENEVPVFNIGTENINRSQFSSVVDHWVSELGQIELENIKVEAKENETFYGRGYNLEFVNTHFSKTLVLATEIKKIFSDELTGEDFPEIIRDLQIKLKDSIIQNATFFINEHTNQDYIKPVSILGKKEDPDLIKVDHSLFRLLKNFELLAYINPVNSGLEKRRFIKNNFNKLPDFKYRPIKVDAFDFKRKLSNIKTNTIDDVSIRAMYEDVVNSFYDKIDLLSSLNTKKFLYNSLRYFGRPTQLDILNANYILHLPNIPSEPKSAPFIKIEKVVEQFEQGVLNYGLNSKVELSKRVISQVMVLNSQNLILIRPDAKFTQKEVNAMIEHEIGIHMVTTNNAKLQSLKLFHLGQPVNTKTQEGLAILSEYLSGNITLKRLKKIALRVIIVDNMCNGADFIECYNLLIQSYGLAQGDAFTICTRVFRGGGFTKDYLYLSGFAKIKQFWENGNDLKPLLVGKTSIDYYDTIQELISRNMITPPQFLNRSIENPAKLSKSGIYPYIISGLKC